MCGLKKNFLVVWGGVGWWGNFIVVVLMGVGWGGNCNVGNCNCSVYN